MSLIGPVGRKRPRARLAMALLYLILSLGAVTTLYPFVLMISTGLKGPTDQADNIVVPKYFSDDMELLKKYIDDKYAGDKFNINSNRTGANASPELVEKYRAFLMQLPPDYWQAALSACPCATASCKGVSYAGPGTFTSAPAPISAFTIARLPTEHASCCRSHQRPATLDGRVPAATSRQSPSRSGRRRAPAAAPRQPRGPCTAVTDSSLKSLQTGCTQPAAPTRRARCAC